MQSSEKQKVARQAQAILGLHIDGVQSLEKGLSNQNYLLRCADRRYVFKRYPRTLPKSSLLAQDSLAKFGITSHLLGYDVDKQVAIFDYVPADDNPPNEITDQLLSRLLLIHQFDSHHTTLLDWRTPLLSACARTKGHMWAEQLIDKLSSLPADLAFCHNDLVLDNLLLSDSGVQFIDFEYACLNDLYFDLAALVISFELDLSAGERLLTRYYRLKCKQLPEHALAKLASFCCVYLILSIAWYEQQGAKQKAAPLYPWLERWRLNAAQSLC
ncbi:phosphotransferase [Pseudoalteromonas sp. T1lg65]|uniref:phosphotransferase n=1 Tax=Pseudoalteromonas sp. T1lg65 TaxID=2077101 RepID=UPI003F78E1F5